jgi:integrase
VQALRQQLERDELGADYADQRLVFAREDGAPIRPETVSKRFPVLCKAAGVPRIRVHDLRHTAATLMIRSGVPLVVVSKVLRHKTYSFTADTYGPPDPGDRDGGRGHVRRDAGRGEGAAVGPRRPRARPDRGLRERCAQPAPS